MQKYRIQYLSNIFLNKKPQSLKSVLNPCAPYLALCGNIGVADCPSTKKFLKEADKQFDNVFWIPGTIEYATSDVNKPITWREQADKCYESIDKWNLKNTTFCQKYEINFSNYLSILATPGWHTSFDFPEYKVYDYNVNGSRFLMKENDFHKLLINETVWIYSCLKNQPTTKKILINYSPIVMNLNSNSIICQIFGTNKTNIPSSYCGGRNPWIGINMFGSSTFQKEAFIEISLSKARQW
jgi:hypothetical protein